MILIYEDSHDVSDIVSDLIKERTGLPPVVANDSISAMLQFSSHKDQIDLIVFDLSEVCGEANAIKVESLSVMKKMAPSMKVLVLCKEDTPCAEQLDQLGIKDRIPKPYNHLELVDRVTKLLSA